MENPIIIIDQELGRGAESTVYRVEEVHPREHNRFRHHHRHEEARKIRHVLKVPGPQGVWQVNTPEFRRKCIRAIQNEGVCHIPTTIIENPTVIMPGKHGEKDQVIQPGIAQMSPLIEGFEDMALEYDDFYNPEMQEQLIELAKAAERMAREEKVGLDPYGAEILTYFVDGVREEVYRIMERILGSTHAPEYVLNLVRSQIRGVRCQLKNLVIGDRKMVLDGADASYYEEYDRTKPIKVLEPGKICITDIGMHDLSPINVNDDIQGKGFEKAWNLYKKPPAKSITVPLQYLMWSTLVELLIQANPELAKRPDLPFTKEPTIPLQVTRDAWRLGARGLLKFMTPKFERDLARRGKQRHLPA